MESVARPQAGRGPREASAAAAWTPAATPKRAIERGGDVHLGTRGAYERGGCQQPRDASAARDLQTDSIRHAGGQRAVLRRRLVDRHARCHPLAHLAHARESVNRLLDELQARGSERFDVAHRLLHAPGAIGVYAQRHMGTGDRPYRRHATGVVTDADLDLQASEVLFDGELGLQGRTRAVEWPTRSR